MELTSFLKQNKMVSKDVKVDFYKYPYKHVIIDNLLEDEVYKKTVEKFPYFIARAPKPHGLIGETELTYDAYIYGLSNLDCDQNKDNGVFFLNSLFFQKFIAEIFELRFTNHIASSCHWHRGSKDQRSKSGFVHADWSICSAQRHDKDISIIEGVKYDDDTASRQPDSAKVMRSVAYLYYLNNPDNLTEENGGGTGIYLNYDQKSLVKQVMPVNNRLFAFEVSPDSYHGFLGADFDRSAIVNWFHTSPAYAFHRNLNKLKERKKNNVVLIERWIPKEEAWNVENDIFYKNFFDKPLQEVLR